MTPQKLALWGYGNYGRDAEDALLRYHTGRFQLTAVFDRNFAVMNQNSALSRPVLNPDLADDFYRRGIFDILLISIYNQSQREAAARTAAALGIPVLSIEQLSRIREPGSRFLEQERLLPEYPGYSVRTFSGQHLAFSPRRGYPVPFCEDGLNAAAWYDWEWRPEPFLSLFRPQITQPEEQIPGESCLLENTISRNYGHFIFDTLDRLWVMEKSGYRGRYLLPRTAFSPELIRLLGLDSERILWTDDLDHSRTYGFEKLTFVRLENSDHTLSAPVLLDMAQQILRCVPSCDTDWPERIFVKRTGSRRLLAADRLLEKYGFTSIIPEELSAEEQIRCFRNARIVFSPHGAGTANALYMKPGSAVIETFPFGYTFPCCLDVMLRNGVYYLPVTQPMIYADRINYSHTDDYCIPDSHLESAIRNAITLTKGA